MAGKYSKGIELETKGTVLNQAGVQHVQTLNISHNELDLLTQLPLAEGAAHDSRAREHKPRCLEEARVEIQRQIEDWSGDEQGKCIFWLYGMAGTGKSTIAQTVAQKLDEQGHLGASFFFSRGQGDLGRADRLLSTIAYQLARQSNTLKQQICRILAEQSDVAQQSLQKQWKSLILQPVKELDQHSSIYIVVIDALDECDNQEDITLLIGLLGQLQALKSARVRILVTSRPETRINLGFKYIPQATERFILHHDIADSITQHDLRVFLRHEFEEMRGLFPHLPESWPGEDAIDSLGQKAECLFIFAATVCRFIKETESDPRKRLDQILSSPIQTDTDAEMSDSDRSVEGNFTKGLDHIYLEILSSSILGNRKERARNAKSKRYRNLVGPMIVLYDSLGVRDLTQLLSIEDYQVNEVLDSLRSILDIPEDSGHPIQLLHESFRDFLLDPRRCSSRDLQINGEEAHATMFRKCLEILNYRLRRNICNQSVPGVSRRELGNEALDLSLPKYLRYACLYWVRHSEQLCPAERISIGFCDGGEVHSFLKKHILHWLEALGWIGEISEGVHVILALKRVLLSDKNEAPQLLDLIHDAERFVLKNRFVIDTAPLQIYVSALVFSPEKSFIKSSFRDQLPRWIERSPAVENHWSPLIMTLEGHTGPIYTVAFSPDGGMEASGSSDHTVRLWDTMTGVEKATLEGDTNFLLHTIAFSPDGATVASGSGKHRVRFWDTTTGAERATLEGHTNVVSSTMSLSPDGATVASGSEDYTVRLWNEQGTLQGFTNLRSTVAFSLNGTMVTSNSGDYTIRLWDTTTGAEQAIFKGHTQPINTVAFSPNGATVASGSADHTVRLWDTTTEAEQAALQGHTDWIYTVVFSPNGAMVASGSWDHTIRLWDTRTGAEQATLKGHTSSDKAIAVSSDGAIVAFGSWDCTVRLWDTRTGAEQAMLKGHTNSVRAIAFSSDGATVAFGSEDHTVRLWDTMTGAERATLEGHTYAITAVAFSPNGATVVSGSWDYTIRLWDTTTGAERAKLEGYIGPIDTMAFPRNGATGASSVSWDRMVRAWNITTEAQRLVVKDTTTLPSLSISGSLFTVDEEKINLQGGVSYQISPYGLTRKRDWIQKKATTFYGSRKSIDLRCSRSVKVLWS